MYPDRDKAEELLKEAEGCNPGPWGNHSRTPIQRYLACTLAKIENDADVHLFGANVKN